MSTVRRVPPPWSCSRRSAIRRSRLGASRRELRASWRNRSIHPCSRPRSFDWQEPRGNLDRR